MRRLGSRFDAAVDRDALSREKRAVRCKFAILFLVLASPVALAAASGATAIDTADAIEVIATCATEASEEAIGLTDLDAQCPGLEHAVVVAGFAPFLSEMQAATLTRDALRDLVALHQRYEAAAAPDARALRVSEVAGIVRSMQQANTPESQTLAQRVKRWLRELFNRRQAQGESWLAQWLRGKSLPQKATELITIGLIVLVVVLALVVLINELRAAGVLKRAARKATVLAASNQNGTLQVLSFADIGAAPLRDQPSLLLQLVVAALVDAGRLRGAKSLTNRELPVRASFDNEAQLERFRRLTSSAELARYGRESLSAEQLGELIVDGRDLHAQITHAARPDGSR